MTQIEQIHDHHPRCNETDCQKGYCREHRLLFWECNSAEVDGPGHILTGGGDCPRCRMGYRMARERMIWEAYHDDR